MCGLFIGCLDEVKYFYVTVRERCSQWIVIENIS